MNWIHLTPVFLIINLIYFVSFLLFYLFCLFLVLFLFVFFSCVFFVYFQVKLVQPRPRLCLVVRLVPVLALTLWQPGAAQKE